MDPKETLEPEQENNSDDLIQGGPIENGPLPQAAQEETEIPPQEEQTDSGSLSQEGMSNNGSVPQGNYPYSFGQGNSQTGWQPPSPKERSAACLALAALLLGLLSILCSCTVYGSLLAGGLAVILALLSKGKRPRMDGRAKAGILTGCVGILLAAYMLISSFQTIKNDPEANKMFNEMFEQYYGESFEDAWQDAFTSPLPQ